MLLPGIAEVEITEFAGAVTRLEPYDVPANKLSYAQNVAYLLGQVATRFGHTPVYTMTDGQVTALGNWFFVISGAQVSAIPYYVPATGVRLIDQSGPTTSTIIPTTGAAGAVMVPAAERLYVAFYDPTGRIGFAGGKVYGWSIGTDPLFAAPLTYSPTVSETGAGVCTAGTRRIGYITTTRNGYTGRTQPVSGTTFAPVSFTSSGGKNLQVQIAGVMPSYLVGGSIQIVMTTVANPNQYFTVPGATNLATNPTTITLSISDDDLAATGTDVTDRITLISQSTGGSDPFFPIAMWTYSSRMCYSTFDALGFPVIYISDPNDFQFITADQHAIFLEGQRQCVSGFSLRGVNYIAATDGFYANTDNGDVPVNWTPPQRIDGSIGILSATCLYVNPSAGYALIASERGFYLFQGGIFPPLALSYYQDGDWQRINWAAATTVQISEDTHLKQFLVVAPLNTYVVSVTGTNPITVTTTNLIGTSQTTAHLYQTGLPVKIAGVSGTPTITVTGTNTFTIPGGSGTPTVNGLIQPQAANAVMTWDYTDGDTADTAKYSINALTSYRIGATAVIRTVGNLLPEVYYAPATNSTNAALIRKNNGTEANPYRDVDMSSAPAAINAVAETSLIPDPLQPGMTLHNYHGCHMMVRGNGGLSMVANGVNGGVSTVPALSPVPLQANPKSEQLVRWFLRNERQSIRFGTNAVDNFFVLSLIRAYYTDAMPLR